MTRTRTRGSSRQSVLTTLSVPWQVVGLLSGVSTMLLKSQRGGFASLDDVSRQTRTASPTVSVVVPTLNEAYNVGYVLARIPQWIRDVVVVDGHSTDDTISVVRAVRPDARIILARERGKGVALRAGFRAAVGDVIVALDADGSTDPLEIPAFVGILVGGADVALGSRFVVGGGTSDMDRLRRVGNWVLTRCVRSAFGTRYSDLCYGFFAFWRDVLPELDGSFTGFEVETVVHIRAVKAGLRVAEVPSYESKRLSGESNLRTFRDGFRIFGAILTEYQGRKKPGAPSPVHERVRDSDTASRRRPIGIPGEEVSV